MRFSLKQMMLTVALAGASLAVGLPVYRGCSSLISHAEDSKLRDGMTKEQVREILGEPHYKPEVYNTGEEWWRYKCDHPTLFSDPLHIRFDKHGKVDWISR